MIMGVCPHVGSSFGPLGAQTGSLLSGMRETRSLVFVSLPQDKLGYGEMGGYGSDGVSLGLEPPCEAS